MSALDALSSRVNAVIGNPPTPLAPLTEKVNSVIEASTHLPYLKQSAEGDWKVYQNNPDEKPDTSMTTLTPELWTKMKTQIAQNAVSPNQALFGSAGIPGVSFQGVRTSSMDNFNPDLQGGVAQVKLPNGESLNLPNAVAQQILFTAGSNQGRWDPTELFGGGENGAIAQGQRQGQNYQNYDIARQSFDLFAKSNPAILQEGSINPYLKARAQSEGAAQQVKQAQVDNANYTENLDVTGKAIGEDVAAKKQKQYQDALVAQAQATSSASQFNSAGAVQSAYQQGSQVLNSAFKTLGPTWTPTTSNLQVQEKMV